MDFDKKLENAMYDANIHIDKPIDWSSTDFQRFRHKYYWKKGRPLFVILFNGGAAFGDWRDPSTWKTVWELSWNELSIQQKIDREKQINKLKHEKELLRNYAIYRSKLLLEHKTFLGNTCKEASLSHPYVIKKRIIPYYAKQIRSYLVLPIHDIDRNLQSLQYIKPDGFKQFKKNASSKNGMIWLSEPLSRKYQNTLYLCEGYATGCSIYEAMGSPVICALSASNLVSVALLLKTKFPLAQIKICADNDIYLKQNIGFEEGVRATQLTGSMLHYPIFDIKFESKKPTDFNDLFCLLGVEEVENQLLISRKF